MGPGDEVWLVSRLRAGDDEAFAMVVRQYNGRLLSTARRFFHEEQDARDAVQDAFLSAFKAVGGFAGRCKLSTWLHRIVVNTALMKIRRRRRRPETSIEDLLPQFEEDRSPILTAISSDDSVEQIGNVASCSATCDAASMTSPKRIELSCSSGTRKSSTRRKWRHGSGSQPTR
jgi:RNA polymerase sigma factor (sigma-70 family)